MDAEEKPLISSMQGYYINNAIWSVIVEEELPREEEKLIIQTSRSGWTDTPKDF